MKWFGLIAVFTTGILLLSAVFDFPAFGDAHSPANGPGSVSDHYIREIYNETGVPNLVTAVLADYRGYDTMFETVVIFTAGIAIFAILRVFGEGTPATSTKGARDTTMAGDHNRIIIGTTCRLLIPIIQLFGLYVVAHGHHSPGGGFQGGVIFGASFILLALATDLETTLKRFSEKSYLALGAIGILIYAAFGLMAQALDQNFLDYAVLHQVMPGVDPIKARYHSMLGVEIGVAFTVTAIMFAIYANLSSKGELENGL